MLVTRDETTPRDPDRIDVETTVEVDFWCSRFDVTPEGLRACVAEVGPRAEDVEARLKQAGREAFRLGGED